jgi:ribosomal protein L16/L10AE
MKFLSSFVLFLPLALPLAASDPAGHLYTHGIKLAERGKFQSARAALEMLIQTYPESPLAAEAKDEIDASLLLEEGQQRLKSGHGETARVALHTLISVYPESSLVKQAKQTMRKAEATIPTVRYIRFENFPSVSPAEIQQRFDQREVGLEMQKPYDPRDVEEARQVLSELLARQVEVKTRVTSRGIDITFIAADASAEPAER